MFGRHSRDGTGTMGWYCCGVTEHVRNIGQKRK